MTDGRKYPIDALKSKYNYSLGATVAFNSLNTTKVDKPLFEEQERSVDLSNVSTFCNYQT